jgi:hypothetical protein
VPVTATRYQGIVHDFVMLNVLRPTRSPGGDYPGHHVHPGPLLTPRLTPLRWHKRWNGGESADRHHREEGVPRR